MYSSVISRYDTRKHSAQRPAGMKSPSPSYLLRWPNDLAMFSSVSAASLRACSTIMFLFLVSSILMGLDSGRF